jgi:L-galactose dehydrogenase
MEYRTLGKTGLKVSALSFGASSLGGVFKPVDESVAIRSVHTALDLGINYIDVAPYYGLTKAETVLGKALRGIPRDKYYLATKIGRFGQSEFDFSAARTYSSMDESLARMGVDYVDVIQAHDLEFGDLNQIVDETIPAMRCVQEQGKARFVGITGYPLKIFRSVLGRAEVDTILSYNRYSLNDTAFESLLPLLEEKGVGIVSASPVSEGLLTNQGPPAWHPAQDEIKRACAEAATWCRARGSDIARLAIQFSVANTRIATTCLGSANPENVKKAAQWIDETLDPELLAQVRRILAPIQNKTWMVGRPENNDAI